MSQTPLRCAIYTRKSSEEGLEQDFNSLDAQREACAAYVASQNWNDRASAQLSLGWRATVEYRSGELAVRLADRTGADVSGVEMTARVGRPSSDAEDRQVRLAARGGAYAAPLTLAPGAWRIDLASDGDPAYRATAQLFIPEAR